MKVALIGYGRMGKEIERLAPQRQISIVARLSSRSPHISDEAMNDTDVAIHFATPATVLKHVEEWAQRKKNLVVGTTGWQHDLEKVRQVVEKHEVGLVHASNFSLGVNVFKHIASRAGAAFNRFSEYDVALEETHHKDKIDSPSGTALTLADVVLRSFTRKKEIVTTPPERTTEPHQLRINSKRIGNIIGIHRIVFESEADQIEFVHTAKSRSGFALGSLLAAEWILGKKGMFTMDDVLGDFLK